MTLVQHFRVRQDVLCNHAGITLELGKVDPALRHDGEICRGGHSPHPGQGRGFARIDGADTGVGVRAAEQHAVQHAGQLDIGAVSSSARDFVPFIVTDWPGPQHPIGPRATMILLCCGRHTPSLPLEGVPSQEQLLRVGVVSE